MIFKYQYIVKILLWLVNIDAALACLALFFEDKFLV
jgi:hypothetical protein